MFSFLSRKKIPYDVRKLYVCVIFLILCFPRHRDHHHHRRRRHSSRGNLFLLFFFTMPNAIIASSSPTQKYYA